LLLSFAPSFTVIAEDGNEDTHIWQQIGTGKGFSWIFFLLQNVLCVISFHQFWRKTKKAFFIIGTHD
jgi:hypothetical protein